MQKYLMVCYVQWAGRDVNTTLVTTLIAVTGHERQASTVASLGHIAPKCEMHLQYIALSRLVIYLPYGVNRIMRCVVITSGLITSRVNI